MSADSNDLGFSYRVAQSGDIEISRNGRVVTRLRGREAARAEARLESADAAARQQLMARLTGNYRRGNERAAKRNARRRD